MEKEISIEIDKKKLSVEEGATILSAAEAAGIKIPTLCYYKAVGAITSCFVCVVEVEGKKHLVPACTAKAEPDMVITTNSRKVTDARKAALELLLSDHNGDCEGPCRLGCPANIESPKFINEILHRKYGEAIKTIKKSVALPAVLGRICPEICEKTCRRAKVDQPVAICHLRRFVADRDLSSKVPYHPEIKENTGKKAAVIGSGPAGLSCAYYLRQEGIEVTVFDAREQPGGALRYAISKERLPVSVLDSEIRIIRDIGVKFEHGKRLGKELRVAELLKSYQAVFIGTGSKEEDLEALKTEGIETGKNGVVIGKETMMTSVFGVFAGGDCVSKTGLAVRSVASGRIAAKIMVGFLLQGTPGKDKKLFSVRMGPLSEAELSEMMIGFSSEKRVLKNLVDGKQIKENPGEARKNFTDDEALKEAARCMRCDCRKLRGCRLKKISEDYGADRLKYQGERRKFAQDASHPLVVYQPGKCIACGICVKITEQHKDELGLTFIGRGFTIKMGAPLGANMSEAMKLVAKEVAVRCPTAAVTIKKDGL